MFQKPQRGQRIQVYPRTEPLTWKSSALRLRCWRVSPATPSYSSRDSILQKTQESISFYLCLRSQVLGFEDSPGRVHRTPQETCPISFELCERTLSPLVSGAAVSVLPESLHKNRDGLSRGAHWPLQKKKKNSFCSTEEATFTKSCDRVPSKRSEMPPVSRALRQNIRALDENI